MKHRMGISLLIVSAAMAGCSGGGATSSGSAASSASLDSKDQKASYGIGFNLGGQLAPANDRIDRAAFMRGVEDGLQGHDAAIPQDSIQIALQEFSAQIEAAQSQEQAKKAASNAAEGAAYMKQNGAREGVKTTASGLQYEVLRQGDGPKPTKDDQVKVHYRGMFVDGTPFDSSYGGDPAVFLTGAMIPDFTEALMLMPVGSQYRVVLPPNIAYGENGSGPIGPNATLIFEIELLGIVDG
jgi:FKBP-type peptidyl-prolyl cis-trans isomerase FkpA